MNQWFFTFPNLPVNPLPMHFCSYIPQPFYDTQVFPKTVPNQFSLKDDAFSPESITIEKGKQTFMVEGQNGSDSKIVLEKKSFKNRQEKGKKKHRTDDDFHPASKDKKKKQKVPQNSNRNVIPNIIHQVVSFMFKKKKSQVYVTKLLRMEKESQCNLKRYFGYLSLLKEKVNNYVNADVLLMFNQMQQPQCQVYSAEEQQVYMKICRTLINFFLQSEFEPINLTTNRMNPDMRIQHLKERRKLLQKLRQFCKQ